MWSIKMKRRLDESAGAYGSNHWTYIYNNTHNKYTESNVFTHETLKG